MTNVLAHRYRLVAVACALMVTLLSQSSAAVAAWSTGTSGSAAGAAATMPNGSAPSGTASGTSVTLSWAAADLSSGTSVAGYVVKRYNAANGTPVAVGAGCSGVVTATSCTELGVERGNVVLYRDPSPDELDWCGERQ